MLDSNRSVARTWTLVTGPRSLMAPGRGSRGEDGQRATDSRDHHGRSAGVSRRGAGGPAGGGGGGARGDGGGGGSTATAADAPPAQVALALADGSADVSPAVPLEISVTDRKLGEVTLVDEAGAEVPGAVAAGAAPETAVWTPETPLAYGTQY